MSKITIQELLLKLSNPQVYTGKEINVIRKDIKKKDYIHVCLVFPDLYEIGMSHYGLQILYHRLNQDPLVNAERCFLPDKESIATFKSYDFPLFSLENKIPLKEFDLIGFSLLSEMNFTNVLQVLELSQIPLRAAERGEEFPIIAAGSISAINPEPLREFIDIFGFGDGEVLFPEILRVLSAAGGKKLGKRARLEGLAKIKGIYVPALVPLEKRGRFYRPELEPGAIQKRVLQDIDDSFPHEKVIVPITNVVFNRLTVEVARGCPQNCRFCQAKSYYAPFRTRSLEKTTGFIEQALASTGFEDFSLSALSPGDYPHMKELLELIPTVIRPGISFSVSSLRPSSISSYLLSTIALFRRTGITIVPEAGSERLRRVINKDVTDTEIFKAVELALHYNWQKMKLYFMIGLPTETGADIEALVQLVENIVKRAKLEKKRLTLHASFSSFVPKPHTPLQWAARESLEELSKKIACIKEGLRRYRNVRLDFHDPRRGVVETIVARGDQRVGELIAEAFSRGEIFSAWDRDLNFDVWEELIKNPDYEDFLKEIPTAEPLPWDFIQVNYKREYLVKEYRRARAELPSACCSLEECRACAGCFYGFKPEQARAGQGNVKEKIVPTTPARGNVKYNKVRLFYEKGGDFTFFSHLSLMKYIERLIRKSGIGFKCTEGFHPHMKMISLPPLPVYATGLDEVIELFLDAGLSQTEIFDRLNQVSGDFKFKQVLICTQPLPLSRDIHILEFEIKFENLQAYSEQIVKLLGDTDEVIFSEDKLVLKMDYAKGGQERFAKIYKLLDPDKSRTHHLTRTRVKFRTPLVEK